MSPTTRRNHGNVGTSARAWLETGSGGVPGTRLTPTLLSLDLGSVLQFGGGPLSSRLHLALRTSHLACRQNDAKLIFGKQHTDPNRPAHSNASCLVCRGQSAAFLSKHRRSPALDVKTRRSRLAFFPIRHNVRSASCNEVSHRNGKTQPSTQLHPTRTALYRTWLGELEPCTDQQAVLAR